MYTLGAVAILSIAFVVALLVLLKTFRGGTGPVIIITPPDPTLAAAKVVDWKLKVNDQEIRIVWRPKLKGRMPLALMSEFFKIDCTMRDGKTPPVGFDKLTLVFHGVNNDVIIANDGADRLKWSSSPVGNWKSSAGELFHWPEDLTGACDDIEFVDAEGTTFKSKDISEISICMLKP